VRIQNVSTVMGEGKCADLKDTSVDTRNPILEHLRQQSDETFIEKRKIIRTVAR
jgi:hypothetical protein